MGYYDGLESVRMFGAGMKTQADAQKDVEFQYSLGTLDRREYYHLMDLLGIPPAAYRYGAKASGVNQDGVPFYIRGTGHLYR